MREKGPFFEGEEPRNELEDRDLDLLRESGILRHARDDRPSAAC